MTAVSMRDMLDAGVHFGHRTRYWSPRMSPYIFGVRQDIHIINLEKSLPLMGEAMNFIGQIAARKGTVLFVGTKQQARETITEAATSCGMPYVNFRWLGGMLTNFKTISGSVDRLKELEAIEESSDQRFSKKELLKLQREREKLSRTLGGIKEMSRLPDALFIIDTGYERIAVKEAKMLGIPIIGVVDTNNLPDDIDYIIPGNDDSIRAISLYAAAAAQTILNAKGLPEGLQDEFVEVEAETAAEE
ncbi:MAG: 30S ribosomal protein S2 [Gammaproteobacteria bacterium]|nr:30S ribosomal protein S2 [Gammaproteobacteria bacterium]